jgi:DNA-binding response OmpR family regulator
VSDSDQFDVLIVEDDVLQCEELAGFIGRSGFTVEMAHDGSSALRQASTLRPRVALLDYNLPDMSGVQLAGRLRALHPEIAILMMSGRIDGLSEPILGASGIIAFFNKPVPLGRLRQAVLALIRNGSTGREALVRQRGWFGTGE